MGSEIEMDQSQHVWNPFLKGGFFSEKAICFSNLLISKIKDIQKNYPELEIWICCLLLLAGNLNFKFRIVFWNIFIFEIGRFEKHIALSEKKPPLKMSSLKLKLWTKSSAVSSECRNDLGCKITHSTILHTARAQKLRQEVAPSLTKGP